MSLSVPPRFVPTLTEIVAPQLPLQKALDVDAEMSVTHFPEAMVQRILQRVDLVLETRLRDSVRHLVLKQTQALTPLLGEEIERLVRESIREAFDQEAGSQTQHDKRVPG